MSVMYTGYTTKEVFGVSTEILSHSYVDRGYLDTKIERLLERDTHIALRGESKCGKSWLRKKALPNAITVQCRLNKTVKDIYTEALSQLGIQIITERTKDQTEKYSLETSQEAGFQILTKVAAKQSVAVESKGASKYIPVGNNLEDLRFIAEVLNSSGRRLVIEDFHYLNPSQRKAFALDMKALWDFRTYIIVIGIWSETNLLIFLNGDLTGRMEEISIYWSNKDLKEVLDRGSKTLNIEFSSIICERMIEDAFGTVGILQRMALSTLDAHDIFVRPTYKKEVADEALYDASARHYAAQLNALYQTFAQRVVGGVRVRKDSTGIYGHMLNVVMEADVTTLTNGMDTDQIYSLSHAKESRIRKQNLRQILERIDNLQVDNEGRGLILSYDDQRDEVFVVDKQLFFYRKYATAKWPWDRLIEQADESGTGYEADSSSD